MAEKIKTYTVEVTTFDVLNAVNVNEHTEVKDTGLVKLTYLSWAWAWSEVKKRFPKASYEIIKFDGLPYVYDEKTGFMVYTTVTIDDVTHEMWLPVMDGNNRAMLTHPYEVKTKRGSFTVQPATMFDVNKTIMRCLTKNLAMFGLGLYIYAGEDLPEKNDDEIKTTPAKPTEIKSEPQKASSGNANKEAVKRAYNELIKFCRDRDYDIKLVCADFKLNAKSTAEEFTNALAELKAKTGETTETTIQNPMEV